jgi:alpha-aminoadipate carrier protein LysW
VIRNKIYKHLLEKKKMPTVNCPDCEEDVYVAAETELGELVVCDECGEELEVVGLDPIELDPYMDDGFEEFEDTDFDAFDDIDD